MHTVQCNAPDFGQAYAHRALSCPRFRANLCTPGIIVSQISGRLLHTRNDMFDISDRLLHFWNTLFQNPLIASENKKENSMDFIAGDKRRLSQKKSCPDLQGSSFLYFFSRNTRQNDAGLCKCLCHDRIRGYCDIIGNTYGPYN